jgi:hypothetical protein
MASCIALLERRAGRRTDLPQRRDHQARDPRQVPQAGAGRAEGLAQRAGVCQLPRRTSRAGRHLVQRGPGVQQVRTQHGQHARAGALQLLVQPREHPVLHGLLHLAKRRSRVAYRRRESPGVRRQLLQRLTELRSLGRVQRGRQRVVHPNGRQLHRPGRQLYGGHTRHRDARRRGHVREGLHHPSHEGYRGADAGRCLAHPGQGARRAARDRAETTDNAHQPVGPVGVHVHVDADVRVIDAASRCEEFVELPGGGPRGRLNVDVGVGVREPLKVGGELADPAHRLIDGDVHADALVGQLVELLTHPGQVAISLVRVGVDLHLGQVREESL